MPCHICKQPIDYSLTTYTDPTDGKVKRHPMSYELDELIPVSKGGSPFDIDNVAPAHRICNQRRGNKALRKPPEKREDRVPKSREW